VVRARQVQLTRQGVCNSKLSDAQVERWCEPDGAGRRILERCMKTFGLSARTRGRVLKLSRTIADLSDVETVSDSHVSQALLLRCLDRRRMENSTLENKSPETGDVSGD
jgi:magnesium chelatase family protein